MMTVSLGQVMAGISISEIEIVKLQLLVNPSLSVTVYSKVEIPRLKKWLFRLLMPVDGEASLVVPVILQVSFTTVPSESE